MEQTEQTSGVEDMFRQLTIEEPPLKPNDFKSKRKDILNCMVQNWYPIFEKVTFKSHIVPLPEEFIEYLQEDGIRVGAEAFPNPEKSDRYDEGEEEWPDEEEVQPKCFPEITSKIAAAIEELEGEVFPKLNWSSPKDATWMTTGGTLRCRNAQEIFLLLKSSDFIAHDLSHAFDECTDQEEESTRPENFVLALRKWYDLKPAMEFRCFVKNQQLIAISQRDHLNYYHFLKSMANDLKARIWDFFQKYIKERFPNSSYVFDVYLSPTRVVLVDFNPWNTITEPLLYTWNELINWDVPLDNNSVDNVDFRVLTSQPGIQPSLKMRAGIPHDLVDLSQGSAVTELIEKMKEQEAQEKREQS